MDVIIVGAGLSGAVAARRLAERGHHVHVFEKRMYVGGNCHDETDEHQIRIHPYGPHIFHTDNAEVFRFLSRFTDWRDYAHEVTAYIEERFVPVPFNLCSIDLCFDPDKARMYREKLIACHGLGSRISVLSLLRSSDPDISNLGQYVYDNIFRYYSQKQWGQAADGIDEAVLSRVPLFVSKENRYFSDRFQCMPSEGYAVMFERMLSHPNIDVQRNVNAAELLRATDDGLFWRGERCQTPVIYTGALDELYHYDLGILPYRTLDFDWEHLRMERFQPTCVVNYTTSKDYTRITEYKYLTGCDSATGTTICREYSKAFTDPATQNPYYPIQNDLSRTFYARYAQRAMRHKQLILLGRLAEYRYYDMDDVVERAMSITKENVP